LLLSQPVAPSSAGNGPSVFAGPFDACADIIEPPAAAGAGASAARIIMELPFPDDFSAAVAALMAGAATAVASE
jgi:hypothetical protein